MLPDFCCNSIDRSGCGQHSSLRYTEEIRCMEWGIVSMSQILAVPICLCPHYGLSMTL